MSDSRGLPQLERIESSDRCKVKRQRAGPSPGPASHLPSRAVSVRGKWGWAGLGGPRGFLVTAVLTGTELLPGLSQVRPAGQGPPFPAWALPVSMNSLQGMARTKQGAPGTKLEEMQREMRHSQRIFVRVRIKMRKISQTLLPPLNFFHSLAKACISLNSVI